MTDTPRIPRLEGIAAASVLSKPPEASTTDDLVRFCEAPYASNAERTSRHTASRVGTSAVHFDRMYSSPDSAGPSKLVTAPRRSRRHPATGVSVSAFTSYDECRQAPAAAASRPERDSGAPCRTGSEVESLSLPLSFV